MLPLMPAGPYFDLTLFEHFGLLLIYFKPSLETFFHSLQVFCRDSHFRPLVQHFPTTGIEGYQTLYSNSKNDFKSYSNIDITFSDLWDNLACLISIKNIMSKILRVYMILVLLFSILYSHARLFQGLKSNEQNLIV